MTIEMAFFLRQLICQRAQTAGVESQLDFNVVQTSTNFPDLILRS